MVTRLDIGSLVRVPHKKQGIFEYIIPFTDHLNPFNRDCARVLVISDIPYYESFMFEQLRVLDRKDKSIEHITNVVCNFYSIKPIDLKRRTRVKEIKEPRQIAMYFSRIYTKELLSTIAYEIGFLNHSTATHAFKTIRNLYQTDRVFRNKIDEIDKRINS
jgi:chromosomal replication initiation ATPase DnaA